MKSEHVPALASKRVYPYLGSIPHATLLMVEPDTGVVVLSTSEGFRLGHWSNDWDENRVIPLPSGDQIWLTQS